MNDGDFYPRLCPHYDHIFPYQKERLDFALSFRSTARRLVDLGCATGWLVIDGAQRGLETVGIDLDEYMIAQAQENAFEQGVGSRFFVANMCDVHEYVERNSIDLVTCMGNTLPHLASAAELTELCHRVVVTLIAGGWFVVRLINYDRILDRMIDGLPPIEGHGFRFVRRYHHRSDGLIDFETILTQDDETKPRCSTVILFPFRRSQIETILARAGFCEVRWFQSFGGEDWTPGCFSTIFAARCPTA